MTVADFTHSEPGEHWIIKTAVPTYSGYIMNTEFQRGTARTKFRRKAQMFDEQFGYLVIPYEGAEGWVNAPDPLEHGGGSPEWEDEESHVPPVATDEEEWGTVGQFAEPVTEAQAAKMGLTSPVAGEANPNKPLLEDD